MYAAAISGPLGSTIATRSPRPMPKPLSVATVSFAATFFYALGGAALFVYRKRQPDAPWKTPGYPWVPAFYVVTSLVFTVAIALDEANRSGRFEIGDYILLVVFGGGLTYASSVIQW